MSSATSATQQVPVGVDPTRASIARVYDAFLNGKDNYEIDRQVRDRVLSVAPEAADMAFENRNFLIRACRFLAAQTGINQFLDCGSGLPTSENVHQVVQRVDPEIRVVYIDNDPVVLAHGRALLEENDHTTFVSANIFDPDQILSDARVRKHIDFSRPLVLMQMGTLHHFEGPVEEAAEIMRTYIDAVPSGSYVALSHFIDPENEYSPLARKMEEVFRHSPMGSGSFRTRAEIETLLEGLELLPPGLTLCAEWWPDGPQIKPLSPAQNCIAGAVGRKP